MGRPRADLLGGAVLLLLAGVLVVQLLVGDADGSFQVAARVLRLVLVLAVAAVLLTARDLLAFGVAAAAVAGLVLTATVGLLVAPEQFVGSGPKAPENPDEARALGLVVTAVLSLVASWVLRRWWRFRRSGGQAREDRAHGG